MIAAGDTLVIPAGLIHRFEPVDQQGWAFASRFVPAGIAERGIDNAISLSARAMAFLMGAFRQPAHFQSRSNQPRLHRLNRLPMHDSPAHHRAGARMVSVPSGKVFVATLRIGISGIRRLQVDWPRSD